MPTLTTSRILRSVADNYHISVWKTDNISTGSSNDNQVKLPLESTGTYNMIVDWGDGNNSYITAYNQAEVTHTYSAIGTYTIKIKGVCVGFVFNSSGDRLKIIDIQSWGKNFGLGASSAHFYGCGYLTISATDTLQDNTLINLMNSFRNCTRLDHTFYIDTSNVGNMAQAFRLATNFNKIVNFNTTSAYSLASFFYGCTNFNQPVNNLNTANVTTLISTFYNCINFNQDISMWNITSVTTMADMLIGAKSWSTANYDLFLISAANQNVKDLVPFACETKYTLGGAAEAARNHLTSVHGWSILDAGGI